MLNFLQIRNYAIVESLDLDFSGGFTCVTGETGAGKSILVDALGVLCGKRAETSTIRSGARKAELSAGFELPPDSPALRWLIEAEMEDGSSCLLRRMINENGRSRAWINGTAVTLGQLAELGERLVEIHGQNEHILLLRSEQQFRLLDESGDYENDLTLLGDRYHAWSALEQQQQSLLSETPLDAGDMDLMLYQIRELEGAVIPNDEFSAIEAEHRILTRGEEILEALDYSIQALEAEQTGAEPLIHKAAGRLDLHASLDKDMATAVELLREAAINCGEAHNSIQSARSRLDLSPGRLDELERQLGTQHDLARKHRVEQQQLQDVLDQMRDRYERAGTVEARLAELEQELESALLGYREAARELHSRRKHHAQELAAEVTVLMQELGMEGGQFQFHVQYDDDSSPSPNGCDRLQLRVSANPGVPPGLLRKVASGGELSRISLAIKVASNSGSAAVTQVFDEVDAGIGGDTANSVGTLLKNLSANGQALCVTHLAQVAAFADHQLQVQKWSEDRETRVETSLLADAERVDEIARMLGGRLSEQSRAHASELLAMAATGR